MQSRATESDRAPAGQPILHDEAMLADVGAGGAMIVQHEKVVGVPCPPHAGEDFRVVAFRKAGVAGAELFT